MSTEVVALVDSAIVVEPLIFITNTRCIICVDSYAELIVSDHFRPVKCKCTTMGRRPLQMRTLLQIGPSRLPSLTFGSGKVSHT